jgi:uncharacterized protein
MSEAIELCAERVLLSPERALIWHNRSCLVIADPHFGKDDVFRRAGIALPRGPAIADLQRIAHILNTHQLERLIVLGDFLHAATRAGDAFLSAFRIWRQSYAQLSIDVVAGNHDRREPREKWTPLLNWHAVPIIDPPFVFAHEPAAHSNGYVLAGHLHPTVNLPDVNRALRVPVFWQRTDSMVLPSFGSFTGGANIAPAPGDRLYAVAPERVVPLRMRASRQE